MDWLPAPVTLGVMAKAPMPGRSKTRMCPPLRPEEAAAIAEAALVDTLAAMAGALVRRRVVVLDGDAGPWLPRGFEVVRQRGDGLAERLANAFDDLGGPVVLIAADSPQVTSSMLDEAVDSVGPGGSGAVLGPAEDGGYWAIGLRFPDRRVLAGIPMSLPETYVTQRRRLYDLGSTVTELRTLRDVDRFDDAVAVAAAMPRSRFAAAVDAVLLRLVGSVAIRTVLHDDREGSA